MAYYGYHRVSTKNQHEDRGIFEIKEYAKKMELVLSGDVFFDKQTGKNFERLEYLFIKNRIMDGDTLIITEADRLGRNKAAILDELNYFKQHGVRVIILEIPTTQLDISQMDNALAKLMIETINNLLIEIYAVLAEAEISKKEKRQREGIAAKKRRGEWEDYGRPRAVDFVVFEAQYARVLKGELGASAVQRLLKLPASTYYRYRKEYHEKYVVANAESNNAVEPL